MGCFVLVTEGRREQQRQKAHNNNTATAIIGDFETTFFFIFLQNSTQLALGITATHHHSLVSSRQKRIKKTKHVERNQTKGPAVMMTHPIPPVPHYHSIHPFIPSHTSHQHSRISFRPAVHRHHLMSTDETESFPHPQKSSNIKHDSS